MSQGGTKRARIEKLNKDIDEEVTLWKEAQIAPEAWQPGPMNFHYRCEFLTLSRLVQRHLELSDEDMNIVFKEVFLEQLRILRPQAIEQRSAAIRAQIMANGRIAPPDIGL